MHFLRTSTSSGFQPGPARRYVLAGQQRALTRTAGPCARRIHTERVVPQATRLGRLDEALGLHASASRARCGARQVRRVGVWQVGGTSLPYIYSWLESLDDQRRSLYHRDSGDRTFMSTSQRRAGSSGRSGRVPAGSIDSRAADRYIRSGRSTSQIAICKAARSIEASSDYAAAQRPLAAQHLAQQSRLKGAYGT